jgi:hypothetical protein
VTEINPLGFNFHCWRIFRQVIQGLTLEYLFCFHHCKGKVLEPEPNKNDAALYHSFLLKVGPFSIVVTSVAEPHHFDAAPAPGKNFDAASGHAAPAPPYYILSQIFPNKQKLTLGIGQFFLLISWLRPYKKDAVPCGFCSCSATLIVTQSESVRKSGLNIYLFTLL